MKTNVFFFTLKARCPHGASSITSGYASAMSPRAFSATSRLFGALDVATAETYQSIRRLVRLVVPLLEEGGGVVELEVSRRDRAALLRKRQLLVEKAVVEAHRSGHAPIVRVDDAGDPRPENGREAHRARLRACVNYRPGENEVLLSRARVADGLNLRVGRRIVVAEDAVRPLADDRAPAHHDGAERSAPPLHHGLASKLDGT